MKEERRVEPCEADVERMRRMLYRKVDEAIERMLGRAEEGVNPYEQDFTGRESLALAIGKEIGALALELNLAQDPQRKTAEESVLWQCPRCGADSQRAKDDKGRPREEDVVLKTRVGPFPLRLPLFRCARCRKFFSPLPADREPGPGDV